jgi:phosphoribosylanthranilate isomerase
MIVQIYTSQTVEEGLGLVKCGVDHIGVTPSNCGLPGEISNEQARDIFKAIGSQATKVALTVEETIDPIVAMVNIVKPDILHLCGKLTELTPDRVKELRLLFPDIKIMQAIPVIDRSALSLANQFQSVADYFILDSFSSSIGGIGAAGFTHDWTISRDIVIQSSIPVILAGGLSPDNVEEAMKQVHPWGVDSLTHTNRDLGDHKFEKDLEKVMQFVTIAKNFSDQSNK